MQGTEGVAWLHTYMQPQGSPPQENVCLLGTGLVILNVLYPGRRPMTARGRGKTGKRKEKGKEKKGKEREKKLHLSHKISNPS